MSSLLNIQQWQSDVTQAESFMDEIMFEVLFMLYLVTTSFLPLWLSHWSYSVRRETYSHLWIKLPISLDLNIVRNIWDDADYTQTLIMAPHDLPVSLQDSEI